MELKFAHEHFMLLEQTPAGSVLPGDDAPLNLKTTMPKELMRPTDSITWSVILLVFSVFLLPSLLSFSSLSASSFHKTHLQYFPKAHSIKQKI